MKDLPLTDEMVDYIDNLIKERVDTKAKESFRSMLESEVSSITLEHGNIVFHMYDGSTVYKPLYQGGL